MLKRVAGIGLGMLLAWGAPALAQAPKKIELQKDTRIILMGNGLGSRMLHFGHFETGMHLRYPDLNLYIRNMCDEGNTPSLRPHSGRKNQLGFPGAEAFFGPYADGNSADAQGHFETDEQWMTRHKPDIVVAFFGFNESFLGGKGIKNFQAELDAFVKHTLATKYNGDNPPQLVLVSPIAFEDRTDELDVPDGKKENGNLAAYATVIEAVAAENNLLFVDVFSPSVRWYKRSAEPLTADGALLNDAGYEKFSKVLIDKIFGATPEKAKAHKEKIQAAVKEKNWFWINDFKIPNGVHVFGRRYNPYGPANYPFELNKVREMTAIRDQAIWAANQGKTIDVAKLDKDTSVLPPVKTNYKPSGKNGALKFLTGEEALKTIAVPEGYKIEQWATEVEFPDLQNPVQMSFDNKGRLWIAVMPSYPHYRPGDAMPNDKLIILEDTNNDGKADKQTTFADKLHLPMGFEFAPEGVYVSQGVNLVLLTDADGDDKMDGKEIILSGFDDHDTHHAISAYCADPSGAFLMCEGVFLRSNVETPYGPVRGTDGGFFRYNPQRKHLERHAQLSIPNPWGIAFDGWGQHFFLHTSGTTVEWMLPGSVKPRYGVKTPGSRQLIEPSHRVRPTSGIEFMSSRHFPDDVQGDLMLCNAIGFLGTKQHKIVESGTGFDTTWRQDLTKSSDGNYRPVDLEIAPDGSLYLVDWHNPLIGHMQHNARDPNRDHDHGRIYRITYPSRPLVKPAKVHGATIPELLANLKLPEYRTRYRSRRELRGRDADQVLSALKTWGAGLDKKDPNYEHHLVEAMWVKWGLNRVDGSLVQRVLASPDHRARAAAVRVVRYNGHRLPNQADLLKQAAADVHGRVKMEAVVAASWLDKKSGLEVLDVAAKTAEQSKLAAAPKTSDVQVSDGGKIIDVVHRDLKRGKVNEITFSLKGQNKIINLAEIEIFSGGKNIAKQGKWSMNSKYAKGDYPVERVIDGNKDNFAHSAEPGKNPRIAVRFDPGVSIEGIKIWNRPGYESRFDGAQIAFKEGNKALGTVKVSIGGGGGNSLFDDWLSKPYNTAVAHLNNQTITVEEEVVVPPHLKGASAKVYLKGAEIYNREGHCGTCHQPDGNGLPAAQFPPLAASKWVMGSEERLINLTLHGLHGPIEVKGRSYPGLVPMTPFKGILNDAEIAAVLSYVRNAFGNKGSLISPVQVKSIRDATTAQEGFLIPAELLKKYPH